MLTSITYIFLALFSHPTGSEAEVPMGSAEMYKTSNPDHIGGFQVAMPIFSGIESKFGLVFPKFQTGFTPLKIKPIEETPS